MNDRERTNVIGELRQSVIALRNEKNAHAHHLIMLAERQASINASEIAITGQIVKINRLVEKLGASISPELLVELLTPVAVAPWPVPHAA